MIQCYNATMIQCYNDSMLQWFNDSMLQWFNVHIYWCLSKHYRTTKQTQSLCYL